MHNSSDGTGFDTDRAWKLLIGGEWVDPAAGTYPVIDPNDGTVVGHAPEATAGQAADAARAARDALGGWRALSPAERGSHLAMEAAWKIGVCSSAVPSESCGNFIAAW